MTTVRQGVADARSRFMDPVLGAIPVGIAIACSLAFLAASLAATFADRGAIREHVAAAYASKAWRPHGNDCLVSYMLLAPYDSRLEEALFPKQPRDVPDIGPCPNLREVIDGQPQEYGTYQRYLHGIRTIVAPLLSHLEPREAGWVLYGASYTLLVLSMAALLWRRWVQGAGVQEAFFDVRLALPACMLLFYVTRYYGTSLAFASSDMAIYALLVAVALVEPGRLPPRHMVVLAALFGAVIAYLEFLSGQAPLGLTVLLAFVAAGASRAESPTGLTSRLLWTGYAFTASLILCFAIKVASVLLIAGDANNFGPQLLYRMGGSVDAHPRLLLGIDISQHAMYSPAAVLYAVLELGREAKVLARGSLALGLSLVILAIVGLAAGARARWHRLPDRFERTRTAALVGAALVTPAWYLLFLNHTIIHAGFMIRPLVGSVAIGVWFGCSELAQFIPKRSQGNAAREPGAVDVRRMSTRIS